MYVCSTTLQGQFLGLYQTNTVANYLNFAEVRAYPWETSTILESYLSWDGVTHRPGTELPIEALSVGPFILDNNNRRYFFAGSGDPNQIHFWQVSFP